MSSQAALETPVKNAFGAADAAAQTTLAAPARARRLSLSLSLAEMPRLYASSPPLPLHLHNLHLLREGRTAGGGLGFAGGELGVGGSYGESRPIAFGHAERQIWQYEGSSCHSGL